MEIVNVQLESVPKRQRQGVPRHKLHELIDSLGTITSPHLLSVYEPDDKGRAMASTHVQMLGKRQLQIGARIFSRQIPDGGNYGGKIGLFVEPASEDELKAVADRKAAMKAAKVAAKAAETAKAAPVEGKAAEGAAKAPAAAAEAPAALVQKKVPQKV